MIEYRGDGLGGIRKTPLIANEPVVKRDYGDAFLNPKEKVREEIEYRSFKIKRLEPYFLYYIYLPDGKPLSGGFTSLELATRQIDFFIADNDKKQKRQDEILKHETKEND